MACMLCEFQKGSCSYRRFPGRRIVLKQKRGSFKRRYWSMGIEQAIPKERWRRGVMNLFRMRSADGFRRSNSQFEHHACMAQGSESPCGTFTVSACSQLQADWLILRQSNKVYFIVHRILSVPFRSVPFCFSPPVPLRCVFQYI